MNCPRVEIDLSGLTANLAEVCAHFRPGTEVIFIVKSDAYGHGLEKVVACAYAQGVRWFGVAYQQEALRVRAVAPDAEILIMGVIEGGDAVAAAAHRLTPILASVDQAAELIAATAELREPLSVHLKIDTGMGRIGLGLDELKAHLELLDAAPGLAITGICSHFATVEPTRPEIGRGQYRRFEEALHFAEATLNRRLMRHISSTRALQFHAEWDLDAVRPGIMLYGYGSGDAGMRIHTRPWLEWKANLIQVKTVPEAFPVGYYSAYTTDRPTDIGTVCVGYADGLVRSLSNRGFVLVRGERRPIVGRVSMNWITLDLGPDSGCLPGDEVVLIGKQGGDALWADDMARSAGTIAYEVLVGINHATERRYV